VTDIHGAWRTIDTNDTEFDLTTDDLGQLVIRPSKGFHYFFDDVDNRLITDFVLLRRPRVDTMCKVVLAGSTDQYTPRLRIWKKDKTSSASKAVATETIEAGGTRAVKAAVDLNDAHENFWKLIRFLDSFKGIELPSHEFRIAGPADVDLLEALEGHDKTAVLTAVKAYVGGALTERDVQMLVDRRGALEHFERLLNEDGFVEAEQARLALLGVEAVWQDFFESNPWIFGYGLTLVACEALDEHGLEAISSGANIFTGGGKRIDAAMRTRGVIQSVVFVEIKKHSTELLMRRQYREPDVYQASRELSGAVAQVQKTARKAVRQLEDLHRMHTPEGEFEYELSTIEPRKVVVIGNMNEVAPDGNVNVEKMASFELFRRSQLGVEILTFDELLERTRYIVETGESADSSGTS
jgi:hypothetical protein